MKHYCSCPDCGDDLDLDDAIKEEGDQPYFNDTAVFTVGDEFTVEVKCPKCEETVTVDCEVTIEFNANIY